MIVVDTSAILCILFREPEAFLFEDLISSDAAAPLSCRLEAALVWRKRGGDLRVFDAFMNRADLVVLPHDAPQAEIAIKADRRFGRGTGHPARLNFGDCLAYAAAMAHDAPLLFKGDDFARTDVRRAV
jgi:ribonuclease VapC